MGSHWRQEGDPVTTPSSGHLPKTPYMEGGGVASWLPRFQSGTFPASPTVRAALGSCPWPRGRGSLGNQWTRSGTASAGPYPASGNQRDGWAEEEERN